MELRPLWYKFDFKMQVKRDAICILRSRSSQFIYEIATLFLLTELRLVI